MKNLAFTTVAVLLAVLCIIAAAVFVNKARASRDPELKFTPEQKAVLMALRNARADLENTKAEVAKMIADAQALRVQVNPNNVQTTWLDLKYDNGRPFVASSNGGPSILWGFRTDGGVIWKMP